MSVPRIERPHPGPHGLLTRAIHRFQETAPLREWRERRALAALGRQIAFKLFNDVRERGFVVEHRIQPDRIPDRTYYVCLVSNDGDQKYAVTITQERPKPWRASTLRLEASDDDLPTDEYPRVYSALLERDFSSPAVPLSHRHWRGNVKFNVERWLGIESDPLELVSITEDTMPVSREEKIAFLHELLNAKVNEETTREEYDRASALSTSYVKGAEL